MEACTRGGARGPTFRTFARRAGRVMLIVASVLLVSVLVLVGVLLLWSPGRPRPFLDDNGKPLPGSISEKIHVTINGVEQGMFIKGKDASNPVLLYLHGGMPDYFLTERYPTGLDEYFTVVWWEQRGSGLSYSPDIPPESVNPDQLVSDTLAVTNYLRETLRTGEDLPHGAFGGDLHRNPGRGAGPGVVPRLHRRGSDVESARVREARVRLHAPAVHGRRATRRWCGSSEKHPSPTRSHCRMSYRSVRDVAMHSLGIGTTHDMKSIVTGLLLRSFENS